MKKITLQECADYLESAEIENSFDKGFEIVHTGVSASGSKFVLINDAMGNTLLGEYQ